MCLNGDVSIDDFACCWIDSDLTGRKQQVSNLYSLRIGSNGSGRVLGSDYFFFHSDSPIRCVQLD
jgi:hypothetical protein